MNRKSCTGCRTPLAAPGEVVADEGVHARLVRGGARTPDGLQLHPGALFQQRHPTIVEATGCTPTLRQAGVTSLVGWLLAVLAVVPSSLWVVVNKARATAGPLDHRPETGTVEGYQVARPVVGPLTRLLADSDGRGWARDRQRLRSYDRQPHVYAAIAVALRPAAADRPPPAPATASTRPASRSTWSRRATPLRLRGLLRRDPGRALARPQRLALRLRRPLPARQRRRHRLLARALAPALRRQAARDRCGVRGRHTLEEFFDIRGGDYP